MKIQFTARAFSLNYYGVCKIDATAIFNASDTKSEKKKGASNTFWWRQAHTARKTQRHRKQIGLETERLKRNEYQLFSRFRDYPKGVRTVPVWSVVISAVNCLVSIKSAVAPHGVAACI